jgi:hypothetical protein
MNGSRKQFLADFLPPSVPTVEGPNNRLVIIRVGQHELTDGRGAT